MSALGAVGEGLVELSLDPGARRLELGFGGDAANACVMASRLGAPARFAGRVGEDALGDRLMMFWQERGVDVSAVWRDSAASTGLYLNDERPGGEHRFTYWRSCSAGSRLEPQDLIPSFFKGLGILLVTGVTLAVSESSALAAARAVALAREAGARIACMLNHRPALAGNVLELAHLARGSDIVIASREDASAVLGASEPAAVAEALSLGPSELVLTDGSRPAAVTTSEGTVFQPIPPTPVGNAAGAGDALAGAYLAARLRGELPETSLRWGVAAAGLSVRGRGCAASYPSREATETLFASLASPVREAVSLGSRA